METPKKRREAEKNALRTREELISKRKAEEHVKQRILAEKTQVWREVVLPRWHEMHESKQVGELCAKGIPPGIRGKIWSQFIGNDLQVISCLTKLNYS